LKPHKKRFFDTPFARAVGFYATVLGCIFSVPTGTTKKVAPPVPAAAIVEAVSAASVSGPSEHPTTQTTYRVQSPDISRVTRDVRIKYAADEVELKSLSEKVAAPPSASASSAHSGTQTTYRIQSPDVSDVRGNVDIEYGHSVGGIAEKSGDGKGSK
jgi:hypothetical protein